ncbi:MAG: peptide chain release factor N(5)-glutamine methyltransferase [Nitrospinales bacterium]
MNDSISGHIDWGENQLTKAGIENPRSEAELLLAEVLCINRQELWQKNKGDLENNELILWKDYIHRRSAHEPFAHIVGHKEFWSIDFKVNSQVLIPRPETEHLIDCLLEIASNYPANENIKILDLGTGSGNIAVVAAREIPHSKVTAIDLKPEALALAEENVMSLGVSEQVQLIQSNLFDDIDVINFEMFDYILSNPPYIKSKEIENLMIEVRDHEPKTALDGGDSGLEFYERIISESEPWLKPGGHLIFEIGVDQADEITLILEKQGIFESPLVRKDYSERDRIISVQRKMNG